MPTFRKRLGRWRVEVVRAGVRESATFDSKREASEWATRREAELLEQRRKAVAGRWTLRDAFERYAREVSPSKRGARWERVRLAKLAKDTSIATRPLRALSGADVAAWRDRRLREVAPASVAREMNLVRSVLEIARKEWGWIKENPMRDVARPARPPGRDRRISEDEATRIWVVSQFELSRFGSWHGDCVGNLSPQLSSFGFVPRDSLRKPHSGSPGEGHGGGCYE